MTISTIFTIGVFAFSLPPTIDPKTFGDKDPVSFIDKEIFEGKHGTYNYHDFSSALNRAELADRIANLPITDEMRQALVACASEKYPSYIAAQGDVASRHVKQYFKISVDLVEQSKIDGKEPTARMFLNQNREADEIQRELISAEHDFIQSVQICLDNAIFNSSVLDDRDSVGANILESFNLRADYRYSQNDGSLIQRGTEIDLRAMINQFYFDLPDRKKIEIELIHYERSLAALKPAQYKVFYEGAPRMCKLIERFEAGTVDKDTFIIQAKKVRTTLARLGVQIRNEALDAAFRITNKLPADKQQSFRLAIHTALFPEFEVDSQGDSLRAEFTAALVRTDLPKDIADRVANLQQSWSLEFDVWQTNADATLLKWSDGDARREPSYSQEFFKPMLAELLNKRAQLHDKWRVILVDQLPVILK